MAITWDIAVIGAGGFGTWTAWHLARAGQTVLLLDAWGPGHSRSSSGDESRIIRMGYGADAIYTRMAMRSLLLWKDLFREVGQPLFQPTGVLWMAREGDAYSEATRRTVKECGVRAEVVAGSEMQQRWPQMRPASEQSYVIFEPDSGTLLARRAVAAVAGDAVERYGVRYERALAEWPAIGKRAGVCVFACGPWLPKVFPELLGRRIYPTRQEVFYFAPPAGDARFAPPAMPAWVDFTDPRGPYGVPDLEGRGLKVGFDRHGPPFDPDTGSRQTTPESVAEAQRFLAERFPALAGAPLTEARVCQYENSSNGDLLIDRHPEFENVWLVGGGSGHGFKHSPAVGEYVASQVLRTAPAEPRFSLASKGLEQQRAVY